MADAQVKLEREKQNKVEDDNSDMDVEKLGSSSSSSPSSILASLNLALILSSLSLSDDECGNFEEEIDKMESRDRKKICDGKGAAMSIPNSNNIRARRREVNEFRAVGRQMAKVKSNTIKIKDCRHGRKM